MDALSLSAGSQLAFDTIICLKGREFLALYLFSMVIAITGLQFFLFALKSFRKAKRQS